MDKLLQAEFGWNAIDVKKLDGYDNANYLIKTASDFYIFKTYPYHEKLMTLIEAETALLLSLSKNDEAHVFPKPIQYTDCSFVKVLDVQGKKTICRGLSFLEGDFLGSLQPTAEIFESFGLFLAEMDLKLQQFTSYRIMARQWEWDIQYLHLNKKYICDIPDAGNRSIVRYFFQQFEEKVLPILPELRKQIIHNDANEWNVLVKNGRVLGLIDFGDVAYTPLINELAIAITYACYDKEDPLTWATIILKSYHSKLSVEEKEVKVLYYLIAARLVISVCNSGHARKINPDNAYASISEKSAWKMLYLWLEISPVFAENHFRTAIGMAPVKPPAVEDMAKRRRRYISSVVGLSYEKPIYMVRSAFQYMYDAYGHTFLDAYNNIPHVGHAHPRVVEAGQKQMARLNTNTRYVYDLLMDYAEALLATFPDRLNKVYFVNSGSAASDLAIRMAKKHTGYTQLMVMEHGYHGHTQTAIDISDYKFSHPKGQGQQAHILKTQIPDTFRGKYTMADVDPGKMYAKEAIAQMAAADAPIAAFISEPIVGCGGQVPLAAGYLEDIYPAIRKQGGVCISDEVQTGFGRLGDDYWGFEMHKVVPDMVIIGKPMANGHPMGAVICTDEIAASFDQGVEFFSSFGGNPVSCAIGLAVLEVMEEEALQQHAKQVGDYYKMLLSELGHTYACVGDVRGSGLFLGIEMVKEGHRPNTELAHRIKNELRNQHILISTDGPYNSVLKSKPPLCFTKENATRVVEAIEEVLKTSKNRSHDLF